MKNSLIVGMEKNCKFIPPPIELHFDWCRFIIRIYPEGALDFDQLDKTIADAEVSLEDSSDPLFNLSC